MKRRELVKYLALSIGGTIALPAWANGWKMEGISAKNSILSLNQEATLSEMVETIIPETDIPGAKNLQVQQFILKIIQDCSDKKTQEAFKKGFTSLDEFCQKKLSKSFIELSSQQRTEILLEPEKDKEHSLRNFYSLVKDLTIWGYMTSEYVMVNHQKFRLVPGKFQACVAVEK